MRDTVRISIWVRDNYEDDDLVLLIAEAQSGVISSWVKLLVHISERHPGLAYHYGIEENE